MPPDHPILNRRRRDEARIDNLLMCIALIVVLVCGIVFGGCTGPDRARLNAGIDVTAAERALDKRYEGIKTMCLYEMTHEDVTRAQFGLDWMRCVKREMGI